MFLPAQPERRHAAYPTQAQLRARENVRGAAVSILDLAQKYASELGIRVLWPNVPGTHRPPMHEAGCPRQGWRQGATYGKVKRQGITVNRGEAHGDHSESTNVLD